MCEFNFTIKRTENSYFQLNKLNQFTKINAQDEPKICYVCQIVEFIDNNVIYKFYINVCAFVLYLSFTADVQRVLYETFIN